MKLVDRVLRELRALANPGDLEGMARFGIDVRSRLGVHVPELRAMAKRLGKDQTLAEELWDTGIPDARILAALVGDPALISRSTMDKWVRDFTSWDVCDGCCCLFDRTPMEIEVLGAVFSLKRALMAKLVSLTSIPVTTPHQEARRLPYLAPSHAGFRRPIHVADVQHDASTPEAPEYLPGIHAVLTVPLLQGEKVIGGMAIRRTDLEGGVVELVTRLLSAVDA